MWLWWMTETSGGIIEIADGDTVHVALDRHLTLSCAWDRTGTVTIKGENVTRAREAREALQMGKWPRKIGVIFATQEHQYDLDFVAEDFDLKPVQLPEVDNARTSREEEEVRLARANDLYDAMRRLLKHFIRRRLKASWVSTVGQIHEWIESEVSE